VVLALSGGASALAVAPAGLSLAEKIAATSAVARSGAPIGELNAVRKHLSRLKGGRLAAATAGRIVALLLSDVVGDDASTIGSGPAVADPTSFGDALAVARRAGGMPEPALAILEAGARGEREETPKPGDPRLARVEVEVLAGPGHLARAAAAAAERRGLSARVAPLFTGTVEELAAELVRCARAQPPGEVTVIAGEPTLRVPPGAGRGGRAQHTALLVARALSESQDRTHPGILCIASDGSDGPTADAGALVTAETVSWVRAHRERVDDALAAYDSGTALAAAGALVTTGATGTNLCDLYLVGGTR
jgi:hydroxypyruvate reductase